MSKNSLPERDNDGQLPTYAWPGGYPLFYLDSHCDVLCPSCATKALDNPDSIDGDTSVFDDDRPVAYDINYEDESMYCDDCSKQIPSAYGEDEEETTEESSTVSNVVAIVGDASMYHVDCARKVYGSDVVDTITGDDSAFTEDWPTDSEGNDLGVVLSGSEDLTDETGQPCSCGHCLGYLIEDDRPSDSPLARDIINLTEQYRKELVTRLCSEAAYKARQFDTQPDTLERIMTAWCATFHWTEYKKVADTILKYTQTWCEKYRNREIVKLHYGANEYADYGKAPLLDTEGYPWEVFDMRGYLDMWCDGEDECESCGRRLESHVYYAQDDTDGYCPECVIVE